MWAVLGGSRGAFVQPPSRGTCDLRTDASMRLAQGSVMLHPAQRLISSLNTTELIISVPIAHVIFLDGNYFLGYELSSCPFKLQVFMDVSMIPDTAGPRRLSEFHSMDEYVTILKAWLNPAMMISVVITTCRTTDHNYHDSCYDYL